MALGPHWCDKIQPYEFGATLDLGTFPNGQPHRRRIKEFMTELIQRQLTQKTIQFPPIPDRERQYANHTYQINQNGQITYTKGDDHIIDADRCALLAQHLDLHPPQETHPQDHTPSLLLAPC